MARLERLCRQVKRRCFQQKAPRQSPICPVWSHIHRVFACISRNAALPPIFLLWLRRAQQRWNTHNTRKGQKGEGA